MKNKRILIIGGTGSLGQALSSRLKADNEIILFSRDELKQWTLKQEHQGDNILFDVGDMRDYTRMSEVIKRRNPHVILIAAALKQVDTCEVAPSESIKTNILGVENIATSIERNRDKLTNLESVLMISTDKACAPTNVYGMSKAIAERVVISQYLHIPDIKFHAVRYGNVLDSRGSILPLFRYQADHTDAFTLTHADMTRFLMTLDDSIDLIIAAVTKGASGTTWLPRLNSMKIMDLAEIFSEKFGKPIKKIGIRPGEKLHEELISPSESVRVREDGNFYIMAPSFDPIAASPKIFGYSSDQDVLSKQALFDYLNTNGFLDAPLDSFSGGAHIDELRKS